MNNITLKALFCILFIFIATTIAQNKAVPRFDTADCAVPVPAGEKVVCGFLTVPENRSKRRGKTIRLPIVILKSDAPAPKPDPVLRTLGGPGVTSLKMINSRRYSPWLKERDMIIFEQRGTKFSQPSLECPEVNETTISAVKLGLDQAAARKKELAAVRQCRDRLVSQGIDLAAYNSTESAADIEDLRRALKLEKINLYGLSYSARLMLNVMRDHPAGIRSVVLESTLPLEVNYDEVGVDGIKRTLDELFRSCAADADCGAVYPFLERDFYALVTKLNIAPATMKVRDTDIKFTGHNIVEWLADYSFSSSGRETSQAPFRIYQLIAGDYSPMQDYAASRLQSSSYSLGMRYSVWCREEAPFENKRLIADQSSKYPALKGYEVQSLPYLCPVWNIPAAKAIENKPVKSAIPTLILGAQYDAYTPPEWGRATAKNLKNSFFYEIPWAGHSPAFNSPPCVNDMIAAFLDDPRTAPGSDCIEKIRKYFKFKARASGETAR